MYFLVTSWTSHLHLTWTSHLNGKILTDCRGRLFRLTSWTFLVQHGWPATPRRATAQWSELGPGECKHKTETCQKTTETRCFVWFILTVFFFITLHSMHCGHLPCKGAHTTNQNRDSLSINYHGKHAQSVDTFCRNGWFMVVPTCSNW